MKTRIVERIGQADMLLPARIAEGLAANDRAKVRMSALQAAATQADGVLWVLQIRAAKRTTRRHCGSPSDAVRRLEGLDLAALAIKKTV